MPIIEVKDLVKRYNGNEAVRGVSFEVNEGETFGFLGPNGAGKTTTINILCTLLGFDAGAARVNGFDCRKEPGRVRSSIGLVFQEHFQASFPVSIVIIVLGGNWYSSQLRRKNTRAHPERDPIRYLEGDGIHDPLFPLLIELLCRLTVLLFDFLL